MSVVRTVSEAENSGIVFGAVMDGIIVDGRVLASYGVWRAGHNLPELIRRYREEPCAERAQVVRDAILAEDQRDTELLRILIEELSVGFTLLGRQILGYWQQWALDEWMGQPPQTFRYGPRRSNATIERALGETAAQFARRTQRLARAHAFLPSGRRAAHGGAKLRRDGLWYYRNRIKRPPDSVHVLTEEYIATMDGNARSEAHSVVSEGIARAEKLLKLIAVRPPSLE